MDFASACKVFSSVFGVAYFAVFYSSWSPFLYYPEESAFHIGPQLASAGPPILWYGWIAVAAIVSAIVAVIIPAQVVRRCSPALFWMLPAAVLVIIFFYEKRWFL